MQESANPRRVDPRYEMDLGLNHVTRKFADAVDHSAHALIAVPGGVDGPSGVCRGENGSGRGSERLPSTLGFLAHH